MADEIQNTDLNDEQSTLDVALGSAEYTDDDIQTLKGLQHIRRRPGMYIGRLGNGSQADDGIYVLFKEVIDNALDEFMMGYGRRIDVTIDETTFTVRDYGRGIPQGKLVDCVADVNTGGKFKNDKYEFAIGQNGVGVKAVNALSSLFIAESIRNGKGKRATFKCGELVKEESFDTSERNGTKITFTPDPTIFVDYRIHMDFVERRIWMHAYLNTGLNIYLNNQRYFSKNGLVDLLQKEFEANAGLYNIVSFKNREVEFAFCHAADSGEKYFSFVNGQYTVDGGTHLSSFKGGLLRAVNEHFNASFDARDLRDGIIGAIAVRVREPMFESQTKNKLASTDVKTSIETTVKDAVINYLMKNPEEAEKLLAKIKRNENIRKEFNKIRNSTKDMVKKISLRNSKLNDCRHHFGDRSKFADQTMIFLTEGDSAGGTLVQSRNSDYQAVYALRGKPLNTYGKTLKEVYTNEELFYITKTLNIEDDIEGLKYAKVVIASDADVDGLHIRNLLITYFLCFFEDLVRSGHLYILETPLFRVRNKINTEKTVYCYSEKDRDEMARKIGKNVEITRFKGLGEINKEEFAKLIDENIRLEKVTIDSGKGIPELLRFYMGDNTPDRWQYIVENLV